MGFSPELEKDSDEYISNRKKIVFRLKLVMLIVSIIEILFFAYNYNSTCMCGHRLFQSFPILISILLQMVANFIFLRLSKDKKYIVNYFIIFIAVSIIAFVIIAVLSKNDMDELHRLVVSVAENYKI